MHIQCNTGWYESVIPVAPVSFRSPPSSTNSNRLWTRAKVNGGQNKGPPQMSSGPKSMLFRWRWRDQHQCTHQYTPTHTREKIPTSLDIGTLWANVLGNFSRAPAHRQPLDTERLRRFAPISAPHYYKGGNEERDGRLPVVKLLIASSYCTGGSFISPVF